MPGVQWQTWEPVYSDLRAHGRLVEGLVDRVQVVVKTFQAGFKVSSRKLKILCHAEGVASQTWTRVIKRFLERNPQWKQSGSSL